MNMFLCPSCSSFVKGFQKMFLTEGISFCNSSETADVIISSKYSELQTVECKSSAILILWTNEARWSSDTTDVVVRSGRRINVMNCYTGNVYVDIFHYLWVTSYSKLDYLSLDELDSRWVTKKPAYFMASNHGDGKEFLINGVDIDLYRLRDNFAIQGHARGIVDVYGQGWPSGIAVPESRAGQDWKTWEERKLQIAKMYNFTVCIENTHYKNLVTEKWWHAIFSKTIPIYFVGDTNVDLFFDIDSILDVSKQDSFESVFDIITGMSKRIYLEKVNSLIESFNKLSSNPEVLQKSRKTMFDRLLDKIKSGVEVYQ